MEPTGGLTGVRGVKAQPGEDQELRDFYAGTYARLVGTLTLAAGNRAEAEEVVQEAFVRLLARWDAVRRYDDPESWVRLVAFRLLSNRLRRARNAAAALLRVRSAPAGSPPADDPVDVLSALRSLPLAQREVVVLHHMLDLSVETIAHQLGISTGTVKSRLARARASLAPLLLIEEDEHA
jgi:RNA polymerase sigma-70 factor (ECF subfamily)